MSTLTRADLVVQTLSYSGCTVHLLTLVLASFTLGGLVLHVFHRRGRKGLILPSKLSTIGAAAYIAAPLGAMFSSGLNYPENVDSTLSGRRFSWDADSGQVVVVVAEPRLLCASPSSPMPQHAAGVPCAA